MRYRAPSPRAKACPPHTRRPRCSRCAASRGFRPLRRIPSNGLRDAARENAKDFPVERLAEHLVFIAGVDVRVDVDFDEIDAVLDLLEIDAVQAAADQVGGPYSRIDHLLRCLADGHRYGLALDRLFLALDLDYLPVAGRHEVLSDEERPPIVNADAPVEVAR